MEVVFWGVRGSKPTPGPNTMLFGGNTTCVQVRTADYNFIFDAGTGIVELGHQLLREQQEQFKVVSKQTAKQPSDSDNSDIASKVSSMAQNAQGSQDSQVNKPSVTGLDATDLPMLPAPIEADIFFSHLHWDHIQGLPFFAPIYAPGNHFRLHGEDKEGWTFQQIIEKQMRPPHFPITMKMMKSTYEFHKIAAGQTLTYKGIASQHDTYIKTFAVNHPNGCLAYRIDSGPDSVVFCTDTAPFETEKEQQAFCEFIRGADVFIYDTHFSDDEYYGLTDGQHKKKWGHSTWEEGTRMAEKAGINTLALFHHKENRSDREQQEIEIHARQKFAGTVAAREGMRINIGGDCPEKVVITYPY